MEKNKEDNELSPEQKAVREFEVLMANMQAAETKKVRCMSRRELMAYVATNRIYLTNAYALITSAAAFIDILHTQNLLIMGALKGLLDKQTFEGLINGNKDYSGAIKTLKEMAAQNVRFN